MARTETAHSTVAGIMASALASAAPEPLRLEPSPRGRVLLRLRRHQARYLDLFQAADDARDAPAAAAWDCALIRVEADIRGVEDDILARPIYSIANVVDLALVAHNRGEASAFVADLVRSASQASA